VEEAVAWIGGHLAERQLAQRLAGVFDQRILGVELRQGVDLMGTQQGRGLRPLTRHDDAGLGHRVDLGHRKLRMGDDNTGGGHGGASNGLSFQVGEVLDRAVGRNGDAVAEALVGGVEDIRLDPCG
jgi:hypothetical protein